MSVPSTPQDLINLIREKLYDNTSGKIEEDTLRNVLENIIKVLDAKFSFFSPTLTEEQYSQWNLMLDYMLRETKGVLTISSTAPTGTTAKGKYLLSDVGTYTNLGGLVTTADKLNYAYFNGTTWSLIAVEVSALTGIDYINTASRLPIASSAVVNYLEEKTNGLYYFNKETIIPNTYLNTDDGSLNNNSSFWTSDYIETKGFSQFISSQIFSFIVFYDAEKKYISGIGQAGQKNINVPVGASFFRFSNTGDPSDNNIKVGLREVWIYPFTEVVRKKFKREVVYYKLTAFRNAENFNSIQQLIDGIEDATEDKRYIIYVPSGEWFECDLHGKEFVEIVGQDLDKTIIYCDGNSNKSTPENYYFQDYKNTALNAIPQQFKHCIFSRNNLKISNLTIKVNDAKYCAHLDHIDSKDVFFKDVKFKTIGSNVNYPVGIGMTGGQKIELQGCIFETDLVADKRAVLFHNTNNQLSNCHLTIRDSFFVNCHYLMLDELGSEQGDVCELLNCQSTLNNPNIIVMVDMNADGKTFWINDSGIPEPNPANVPYSIKLNAIGTYIEYIGYKPFTGFSGNPRPLFLDYFRGKTDNAF